MISPCATVREALALEPMTEDPQVQAHLDGCATCARYRRQHQSLDVVLRAEMSWEAPAALTARLLAIAADPAAAIEQASAPFAPRQAAQAVPARPKTWFVSVVYALTLMIIALSLLVAWQVAGALLAQVEPGAILTQLLALPQQGLTYLIAKLPQSRYLVDFLLRVRVQLMWLLLVAVLWAVLDKANLQFSFRGRQITL
ncbi:hypothetical protein SE17_13655 [Kouleothrix aurantiaca]|jgi:hypothetical protein|uniref:Zinc-finger domain-containing protein n=1 Tax=Kouleothrix aurantiaca TaxID=186479 RepID=A0A0P9FI01_9CHLR|nr:hypothetical protein SE17_13655 [Kouleothrix aurantiaca]